MSSNSNTAKPKLACEISADRVLAGRLGEDGRSLEACAARELAPGCVVPDLVEGNLRQREAVKAAVESTLDSVAERTHDVIAVVPDAAVRVVLLEFDTLPSDSEEAAQGSERVEGDVGQELQSRVPDWRVQSEARLR